VCIVRGRNRVHKCYISVISSCLLPFLSDVRGHTYFVSILGLYGVVETVEQTLLPDTSKLLFFYFPGNVLATQRRKCMKERSMFFIAICWPLRIDVYCCRTMKRDCCM
jgi:hypothetical protein